MSTKIVPEQPKSKGASRREVAGERSGSVDLGTPVLLGGEDGAVYERLLAQVTAAADPADVIEEFWVRDCGCGG